MMSREGCILVVVDVQEKLIDTIDQREQTVQNIMALLRVAELFRIPILLTEQEKLGKTIAELDRIVPTAPRFQKLVFSCMRDPEFKARLDEIGRKTVLLCGIETHICVMQTALDLLDQGYYVVIPRDATSSHGVVDRDTAVERMRTAGVLITTTETTIYELTEKAGTSEFREILEIVKDRRKAINA